MQVATEALEKFTVECDYQEILDRQFIVSLFNNKFDNKPKEKLFAIDNFIKHLQCPDVRSVKDGLLWCPARYRNDHRAKINVIELSILELDIDNGATLAEALDPFKKLGYFTLYHTTFSHTQEHHKFRIIVPLSKPIPSDQFIYLYYWANKLVGKVVDPQSKDESRMFYLPSHQPNMPYESGIFGAFFLDWQKIITPELTEEFNANHHTPAAAPKAFSENIPTPKSSSEKSIPKALARKIWKFIRKMSPSIAGQQGHNAIFAVACVLVKGFKLTPAQAMPFLRKWNQHFAMPQWNERDLWHKAVDADRIADEKARGYLLDWQPTQNDLERWEAAQPTGTCPYFEQKKVATALAGQPAIRYEENSNALILCEKFGSEEKTLQIITPVNNNYRKIADGYFSIIGQRLNQPTKIFLATDIFSLATVYQLEKDSHSLFITAHTLSNLFHVKRDLRKRYGKEVDIYFVVDNTKNSIKVASRLTFDDHNAHVLYPVSNNQNNNSKLFSWNDLLLLCGTEEVTRQLATTQQPDITLALEKELKQYQQAKEKCFSNNNSITIKESKRFLDLNNGIVEQIKESIATQGQAIINIASPLGTAKTYAIASLLAVFALYTVLAISHLRSITRHLAERLKTAYYSDWNIKELVEQARLAICLPSHPKLYLKGQLRKYNIVVLDESEQVLKNLTRSDLISKTKNKGLIITKDLLLNGLCEQIRSADIVLCADANLGNSTINFLKDVCPNKQFINWINEYKPAANKKVTVIPSKAQILENFANDLRAGLNVYGASNSITVTNEMAQIAKEIVPQEELLLINSERSGEDRAKRLYDSPDTEVVKYRCVITSPSVVSSLDISVDHFNKCYGIFSQHSTGPQECVQALARPRKVTDLVVFIDSRKGNLPTSKEELAARWTKAGKKDYDGELHFENLKLTPANKIYSNLWLNVRQKENFYRNDLYKYTLMFLALEGYQITFDKTKTPEEAKEGLRIVKQNAKDREIQDLLESNLIDKQQADEIDVKYDVSYQEHCERLKYEILLNFNKFTADTLPEQTEQKELIKDYRKGKQAKEIANLELVKCSETELEQRIEAQHSSTALIPDRKPLTATRELGRKLLEVVGIDPDSLLPTGKVYSANSPEVKDFIDYIKYFRAEVAGARGQLAADEQLNQNPLRYIGSFLSDIGLKHCRTGKNEKGFYTLNTSHYLNKVLPVLVRRGSITSEIFEKAKSSKQGDSFSYIYNNNIKSVPESIPKITTASSGNKETATSEVVSTGNFSQPDDQGTVFYIRSNNKEKSVPSLTGDITQKVEYLRLALAGLKPADPFYLEVKRLTASFYAVTATGLKPSNTLLTQLEEIYTKAKFEEVA
jgi:hypothetical protein